LTWQIDHEPKNSVRPDGFWGCVMGNDEPAAASPRPKACCGEPLFVPADVPLWTRRCGVTAGPGGCLFELLVVLLDGPALMRQSPQLFKRGVAGRLERWYLNVPSPSCSMSNQRSAPGLGPAFLALGGLHPRRDSTNARTIGTGQPLLFPCRGLLQQAIPPPRRRVRPDIGVLHFRVFGRTPPVGLRHGRHRVHRPSGR
jgi:hypothetical protein